MVGYRPGVMRHRQISLSIVLLISVIFGLGCGRQDRGTTVAVAPTVKALLSQVEQLSQESRKVAAQTRIVEESAAQIEAEVWALELVEISACVVGASPRLTGKIP